MTRYKRTPRFKKAFEALPEHVKKKVRKAFLLFQENPRHPSLQIKKMEGTTGIYEGRIDQKYRFTFHYEGDVVFFRDIGPHDILDEEQVREKALTIPKQKPRESDREQDAAPPTSLDEIDDAELRAEMKALEQAAIEDLTAILLT